MQHFFRETPVDFSIYYYSTESVSLAAIILHLELLPPLLEADPTHWEQGKQTETAQNRFR
jgi:hypothetical protein